MKPLTDQDFLKIIKRRDLRYDGRFFWGVKTTRIYCRPVCPAKPKAENVRIFRSQSEAEKNGFRPCMRCRPDLGPAHRFSEGNQSVIARALRQISESFEIGLSVEKLADSLGITDRHLRRLFEEQLGASPIEIMITQRLHFAKQIIQTTSKPIAEIAFASGFQSVRRFNEAIKSSYHKSPTELRKSNERIENHTLFFRIPIRPPYDWNYVLYYLKRHEAYGIERIVNGLYYRFIPLGKSFGTVVVSKRAKDNFLSVQFINIPLKEARFVLSRIKNLFDTDHNPAHLPKSKLLNPGGIRTAGCYDPFEVAVSIILSQLVSVEQAREKLKALIVKYGRKIGTDMLGEVYEFPSPQILRDQEIEEIGMPKIKAGAIRLLAEQILNGTLKLHSYEEFPAMTRKLTEIRGIGQWTASMVAMRCLGDPDAFPEKDLIIERAIDQKIVHPSDWTSSRAYLTHCLWRDFGQSLSKVKKRAKQ